MKLAPPPLVEVPFVLKDCPSALMVELSITLTLTFLPSMMTCLPVRELLFIRVSPLAPLDCFNFSEITQGNQLPAAMQNKRVLLKTRLSDVS